MSSDGAEQLPPGLAGSGGMTVGVRHSPCQHTAELQITECSPSPWQPPASD